MFVLCNISYGQSISTSAEERVVMADKNFILEFIKVYHALPALWDVKSKDYTNRVKKREQYDVLIEKYREKYPYAEKQDVVRRINSLRTNFRKELKRLREAKKNILGGEDVHPSPWYFEEMKFLQSQETAINSIDLTDTTEVIGSTVEFIEKNNNNEEATETGKCIAAHNRNNQKRKSPLNEEELLRVACKRLEHLPDDYDKIAAAWAVELRKMDPQQQLFAKKAINDVIFEGLMGTLNRGSVKINMT